jgi:agarase
MLAETRTRWGGRVASAAGGSGYFRLARRDGIFWLIDPEGGSFISKGVNTVRFDQDRIQGSERVPYAEACERKYGSEAAWRTAAAGRLAGWGVNTLGAWSDEAVAAAGTAPLAFAPVLDLGMSFAWDTADTETGRPRSDFPDVFDAAFERHILARAQLLCAPKCQEQALLGWFIDNESRWGPDWRGEDELLDIFLSLPATSPGRTATLAWLETRHADFGQFNKAWRAPAGSWRTFAALPQIASPYRRKPPYQRNPAEEAAADRDDPARAQFAADCDAFAALVAERYFAATTAAIRAADPNHLVLGSRFAYVPPPAMIGAAARHCDVVSFNCYERDAGPTIDIYAASGRPCLIGEFSIRAIDSGLPNSNGAGPVVESQDERATCFRHYVTQALHRPALVGYHWFEHADQPAEGRFDGENSNFGTVTIEDAVYARLTETLTAVNAEAEALHAMAIPAPAPAI